MSDRSQWKMLHLLYVCGKPSLSLQELEGAGVYCYVDTVHELVDGGAVEVDPSGRYSLSRPARAILRTCLVANRRMGDPETWVDYPRAFVVMPFSEPWSDRVFREYIEPAVTDAGLQCVRGDTDLRVGELTGNIWKAILRAGIVVADVSALNANVFYELGLAHALGKDTYILKRKDARIPADFGGAHYYEYDLGDLPAAKEKLAADLRGWADDRGVRAEGVRALYDRASPGEE